MKNDITFQILIFNAFFYLYTDDLHAIVEC